MSRTARPFQIVTRVLCTLALVCLAFAHKPVVPQPSALSAAELAAYALPDGTLPILCLAGSREGDGGDHPVASPGCEACRITAAFALAAPPALPVVAGATRLRTPPLPRAADIPARAFPPSAPPRAPPFAPVA